MPASFRKNALPIVIACAALAAWFAPGFGTALQRAGVVGPLVFAIFVCQGAAVDSGRLADLGATSRLLAWGFGIAFGAAPAFGALAVAVLGWQADLRIGFVLMCCMGPTLVSGIVIAVQAGGEREAATLLTVVLNLLAVVMIPILLGWTLGGAHALDRASLLFKLTAFVLVPALLGQLVRRLLIRFTSAMTKVEGALGLLPVILLGATIYVSLAEQSGNLGGVRALEIVVIALPALAVHYSLMLIAYAGARGLLGATRTRSTALAVVCSQKTLPVAIAVWSTEFAASHPLAILPAIVFHMCQVYGDGLLAGPWSRRLARAEKPAPS